MGHHIQISTELDLFIVSNDNDTYYWSIYDSERGTNFSEQITKKLYMQLREYHLERDKEEALKKIQELQMEIGALEKSIRQLEKEKQSK